MNRTDALKRIGETSRWDLVIIGGGATGLGCAVDAAARGLSTLLLEQSDFAKGTSSRSTKLVHGGVRYLKQGNVSLVLEALHERGLLIRNAPHLVHHQSFIVPVYDWWEGPFYGAGLKVYDLLAGDLGLKPSRILSREETLERLPTLEPDRLKGGVMYYDGQFDDSRLALHLAQTAAEQGACLLNYAEVTGLIQDNGLVSGVYVRDGRSGDRFQVHCRVVVNATGVFADRVMSLDDPAHGPLIQPSQGIHLVLDRSFLPGDSAIMVPHTDDGRVLFAVPWLDRVIVGTTDTAVENASLEPVPLEEEVDFVMRHAARYLTRDPERDDILSMFAGLRPLVRPAEGSATSAISRDHTLFVSRSGLITVTGGKWTTYRRMAEDTINQVLVSGGFGERPCTTAHLPIHGHEHSGRPGSARDSFGSDLRQIERLLVKEPDMNEPVHPKLPYLMADLAWSIDHEMAETTEDLLARRTRCLLLDARAAMDAAPAVSRLLARRKKHTPEAANADLDQFLSTATRYLP